MCWVEQFDVEAVQSPSGLDVEGVLANLPDGGNASQWQEETEVIVKISVGADDRFTIGQIFRLKGFAIGGEDELGLLAGRRRACPQRGERGGDFAFRTNLEMDIVALENTAGQVGLI